MTPNRTTIVITGAIALLACALVLSTTAGRHAGTHDGQAPSVVPVSVSQ